MKLVEMKVNEFVDLMASDEPAPGGGSAAALEGACRVEGDKLEMKVKNLLQPLRVAVCGNMVSPPLFESIELLPRADVLARIDAAMEAASASVSA